MCLRRRCGGLINFPKNVVVCCRQVATSDSRKWISDTVALDTDHCNGLHSTEMLLSYNMWHYLRLCDNQCDPPITGAGAGGAMAEDCHGCRRKRKDHEDDYEVKTEFCKYSRQSSSENDSVSFLMRKWSNSDLDAEVPSATTAPVLDEVSFHNSIYTCKSVIFCRNLFLTRAPSVG